LPLLDAALALDGYHLLVVERDDARRSSFQQALARLGARVTVAASPEEALSTVAGAPPPDAVVASPDALASVRRVCDCAMKASLPVLPLGEESLLAQAVRRAVPRPAPALAS
jgi:DNA-binding NtrC family response regulator